MNKRCAQNRRIKEQERQTRNAALYRLRQGRFSGFPLIQYDHPSILGISRIEFDQWRSDWEAAKIESARLKRQSGTIVVIMRRDPEDNRIWPVYGVTITVSTELNEDVEVCLLDGEVVRYDFIDLDTEGTLGISWVWDPDQEIVELSQRYQA